VNTATGHVTTAATGLNEPADVVPLPGSQDPAQVFVVESSAHRLVPCDLGKDALQTERAGASSVAGASDIGQTGLSTSRPLLAVQQGQVTLEVPFTVPAGRKFDTSLGTAIELQVGASPPELLVAGEGTGDQLERRLRLAPGQGVLHVSVRVATCDAEAEFPACHLNAQDWGVPVTVGAEGVDRITLPLG
jgi:hypothetical protein